MPRGFELQLIRVAFALLILLEIAAPFLLPDIASDFTWLGLIVTAVFAWFLIEIFKLSSLVAWLMLGAIIFDGYSAIFQMYSRVEPWDLWVHALGGAIIAAGSLDFMLRLLNKGAVNFRRPAPFLVTTAYLFTAAIGFLYEFWEYLVDKLQYGYPKSLVSAYDSIEDQFFNLLGASVAIAIYFAWKTRGSRKLGK